MRVPDLNWPANLFDDESLGSSRSGGHLAARDATGVDVPLWMAMLHVWTRKLTHSRQATRHRTA